MAKSGVSHLHSRAPNSLYSIVLSTLTAEILSYSEILDRLVSIHKNIEQTAGLNIVVLATFQSNVLYRF